jgi:monoterpene epsilon-lactone hydrolase
MIELPKAPDAIELRHLRAFVAVAEELNFSRAAKRLFMTQPALSRQIRSLERLIGVELLRRSTRQVELTLAGEAMLHRTRPMLGDLDQAVATTRSLGDENQQRLTRLTQPVADTMGKGLDEFREAYEAMNAQLPTPEGVDMRPVRAGGVPCLVYETEPGTAPTVLFVHGGGYFAGSALGSRPLAGVLTSLTERAFLVPDYRLAPEHPYPAAADDVAAAYTWLTTRTRPDRLAVVAESSGCGLLLSALHRIRQAGDPSVLPGRIVLLSPAVDLEGRYVDQLDADNPHSQLLRELVERSQTTYLDGHSATDPSINALYDDLAGLPTILVQAGAQDFCLHDARELVARARDHGVEAHLELYPVATHVFHHYWSFLPEASRALHRASAFINS